MATVRRTHITWNGHEIEHPVGRVLVSVVAVLGFVVALLAFALLAFALLFLAIPLMIALHPLFRLFGRQGTMRTEPDGRAVLALDREAFRRWRR